MRPKNETLTGAILREVKRNGKLVKKMGRVIGVYRVEEYSGKVHFKKKT